MKKILILLVVIIVVIVTIVLIMTRYATAPEDTSIPVLSFTQQ